MIFRWVKRGVITGVCVMLVGGLIFGSDLISYMRSSARNARTAIKSSIPTEFELRRAKDLLEEIIPEMHAHIRLIAEQEVEIAALAADIPSSRKRLAWEREHIEKLGTLLAVEQVSYEIGGQRFTRLEMKEQLGRRFDRFKEAELLLAGKERLLTARQKSLRAAGMALDRTRSQKALLEDQVEALAAQYRLVRAASVGSRLQPDNTKLAQAEKLIKEIKKRLDVAERVLAHEARFIEPTPTGTISTKELLAQVTEHLGGKTNVSALAAATDETPALTSAQGQQ